MNEQNPKLVFGNFTFKITKTFLGTNDFNIGTFKCINVAMNWIIITSVNSLRPRQNGRHFADDIFKGIFLNENIWILFKISLKFVPKVPINNTPALVQIMAWRRPGDKPLSEPMMVNLLTHICVTRPQWVNSSDTGDGIFQLSGINTMLADALAPKVTSASPGMVFTVWDRQHALLLQSWFNSI